MGGTINKNKTVAVNYHARFLRRLPFIKEPQLIKDSYGSETVTIYKTAHVANSILCGYNLLYPNVSLSNCHLGYGTYVNAGTVFDHVFIGAFSSVSSGVRVISGQHPSHFVSTYPGFYSNAHNGIFAPADGVYFQEFEEKRYEGNYSTYVGNDVLISADAVLMEGVHIGDGPSFCPLLWSHMM